MVSKVSEYHNIRKEVKSVWIHEGNRYKEESLGFIMKFSFKPNLLTIVVVAFAENKRNCT